MPCASRHMVPCSPSRVVSVAHGVVGPSTHLSSGPREVRTTKTACDTIFCPTRAPLVTSHPLHVLKLSRSHQQIPWDRREHWRASSMPKKVLVTLSSPLTAPAGAGPPPYTPFSLCSLLRLNRILYVDAPLHSID
jgi:hypothetical protein